MPRKLSKSGPPPTSGSGAGAGPVSAIITTTKTASTSTTDSSLLPRILTDDQPLPRLVVFDLDYTLWPFWVDTHVTPPLRPVPGSANAAASDRTGEHFSFYSDVPKILYTLPLAGIRLGVASRTHAPELARDMLKLLHVPPPSLQQQSSSSSTSQPGDGDVAETPAKGSSGGGNKRDNKEKARRALDFFDGGLEIYPSSKIRHFEALARRTGIPHTEMLFFDDEARNRDVETLGVTMWLVRDGVSWAEVEKGVKEWRRRRGHGGQTRG